MGRRARFNLKPFNWLSLSYRASINNISSRFEYRGSEIKYSANALTDRRIVYSNPVGTGVDTVVEGAKTIAVNDNPHPASYSTSDFNNFLFSTDFLTSVNTDVTKDFN